MPAMKVDLGIWDWLNRMVVTLLVASAAVGLVLWYLPKIQENEGLRLEIYERNAELAQEIQESNQLSAQIESAHDREQVERWIRDQRGWGRSNEVIIRFVEPSPEPQ
jgi:cell division protein FtsB